MSAPGSEPKEQVIARRWLANVDQDFHAIELLMAGADPALFAAAFHCQQAAEKLAKALLILFRTPVPKTHDLQRLAGLISARNPEAAARISEVSELTTWYIVSRYPGQCDETPSPSDLMRSLSKLRALRNFVDSLAAQPNP